MYAFVSHEDLVSRIVSGVATRLGGFASPPPVAGLNLDDIASAVASRLSSVLVSNPNIGNIFASPPPTALGGASLDALASAVLSRLGQLVDSRLAGVFATAHQTAPLVNSFAVDSIVSAIAARLGAGGLFDSAATPLLASPAGGSPSALIASAVNARFASAVADRVLSLLSEMPDSLVSAVASRIVSDLISPAGFRREAGKYELQENTESL